MFHVKHIIKKLAGTKNTTLGINEYEFDITLFHVKHNTKKNIMFHVKHLSSNYFLLSKYNRSYLQTIQ